MGLSTERTFYLPRSCGMLASQALAAGMVRSVETMYCVSMEFLIGPSESRGAHRPAHGQWNAR